MTIKVGHKGSNSNGTSLTAAARIVSIWDISITRKRYSHKSFPRTGAPSRTAIVPWQQGKEISDVEAPDKQKPKQHEDQPNGRCATYSGAKGKSQFTHPLCIVRHLLECDNTA